MGKIERIDIKKEFDDIVESVSKKYGYSEELKIALKRILPAMLYDASYDERLLFYRMLQKTPIEVIDDETNITIDELKNKHFGSINQHIIDEETQDISEYQRSSNVGTGAFMTEVILDEDLNIRGNKQFIYIQRYNPNKSYPDEDKKVIEIFGSYLMIDHLIHELGHAWVGEYKKYTKTDDGMIKERVGASYNLYEFEKLEDGRYLRRLSSQHEMLTEEGLNTRMQENSLAIYLGVDLKTIDYLYCKPILICSVYQGAITDAMRFLCNRLPEKYIRRWRMFGDENSLSILNGIMSKTPSYQSREQENEYDKQKKELLSYFPKEVQEYVEERKEDFFANKRNLTPVQIIDNTLTQVYDIEENQHLFSITSKEKYEKYVELLKTVLKPGYYIMKQSEEILRQQEIAKKQEIE